MRVLSGAPSGTPFTYSASNLHSDLVKRFTVDFSLSFPSLTVALAVA